MTGRETCGGCNSTNLQTVLDLGTSPLADYFPADPQEQLKWYDLRLVRCHRCTLVQLSEVVPDDELWAGDYGFYTGSSWVAVEQQRKYAAEILAGYPKLVREFVVEIASNDGSMLKNFANVGHRHLGIDPATGPCNRAELDGVNVLNEAFSVAVADNVVREHGQAGVVIANNVVAHVANLDDFLAGVKKLLSPVGVGFFEFQYLADLVTGNQFDHVYHEHRSFFSLLSFHRCLDRHGLKVMSVKQTTPQGGSLRVEVQHAETGYHADHSVNRLLYQEEWLGQGHALDGLQGCVNRIQERLRDMLWQLHRDKKIVAGYGASAKSTTLLNFCGINRERVSYFVDATPSKHGRFTPGTNIPIIDPRSDSRAPDVYLLCVWNYLPQIMRRETTFTGQWLVPIPVPVLL